MLEPNRIYNQNCLTGLKNLPDNSIDCCVTSPPYFGLRDYGTSEQIGLEETPDQFVSALCEVFTEVKRVLKDEGTLWLNLGDSYAANRGYQVASSIGANKGEANKGSGRGMKAEDFGVKVKDLIGIPWMVAFALRSSGWYLRQDIIWNKPNPMPESVTDRCTKAHEYIFLLSKSSKYYYDSDSISEKATYSGITGMDNTGFKDPKNFNGKHKNLEITGKKKNTFHVARLSGEKFVSETRNKRSVWTVTTKPFSEAHFATFPQDLIVDCIKAGCPEGGIVLDPFMGAGTTALVARKLNRNYIGFELNPEYLEIAEKRLHSELGMFI